MSGWLLLGLGLLSFATDYVEHGVSSSLLFVFFLDG